MLVPLECSLPFSSLIVILLSVSFHCCLYCIMIKQPGQFAALWKEPLDKEQSIKAVSAFLTCVKGCRLFGGESIEEQEEIHVEDL